MEKLKKTCEWCKVEFSSASPRARFCAARCSNAAYRKANAEKEKARCAVYRKANAEKVKARKAAWRKAAWRKANPEKVKAGEASRYDSAKGGRSFLGGAQRAAARLERFKEDPEKYAAYLATERQSNKMRRAKKKLLAARTAYLADPVNAAKVAAANMARMTPEEREAWHLRREEEQEKADRKAARDAIRRDLAIAEAAKAATQDPTWADLEWSPDAAPV